MTDFIFQVDIAHYRNLLATGADAPKFAMLRSLQVKVVLLNAASSALTLADWSRWRLKARK
jgi:hypothetical protein